MRLKGLVDESVCSILRLTNDLEGFETRKEIGGMSLESIQASRVHAFTSERALKRLTGSREVLRGTSRDQ